MGRFRTLILLLIFSACNRDKSDEELPGDTGVDRPDTSAAVESRSQITPSLSYQLISKRKAQKFRNDSLKGLIDTWLAEREKFKIEAYTDYILELTANSLEFSFEKSSSVPDSILKEKKANCVGYAALFNSLFNYGIKQRGLSEHYKCTHGVGKIFLAGKNLNSFFDDPFFRDHDFNIIECKDEGKTLAVDPSLFDYMAIARVQLRK